MNHDGRNDPASAAAASSKKPYSRPAMTHLGSVRDLTATGSPRNNENTGQDTENNERKKM